MSKFVIEGLKAVIDGQKEKIERMEAEAERLKAENERIESIANYIYYDAYQAGHHDTVEGQYTHVLPADALVYHMDAVRELMTDFIAHCRGHSIQNEGKQ